MLGVFREFFRFILKEFRKIFKSPSKPEAPLKVKFINNVS